MAAAGTAEPHEAGAVKRGRGVPGAAEPNEQGAKVSAAVAAQRGDPKAAVRDEPKAVKAALPETEGGGKLSGARDALGPLALRDEHRGDAQEAADLVEEPAPDAAPARLDACNVPHQCAAGERLPLLGGQGG
jgi:hypothetical protein